MLFVLTTLYGTSAVAALNSLIPGKGDPGYEIALNQKARKYNRQVHLFNAVPLGADTVAVIQDTNQRSVIRQFIQELLGFDFDSYAGFDMADAPAYYYMTSGLYAGASIAADAFWYGVSRANGWAQTRLAQSHLQRDLELLHMATAITGGRGIVARGLAHRYLPGEGSDAVAQGRVMPLFDAKGKPLPAGNKPDTTWRAGAAPYADYVWQDGASRDMVSGWLLAYAAVWEVIHDDPAFAPELNNGLDYRLRLQTDALAIAQMLARKHKHSNGTVVHELSIFDADDRLTNHGAMNAEDCDNSLCPLGMHNGVNAILAVGFLSALGFVSENDWARNYALKLAWDKGYAKYITDDLAGMLDLSGNDSSSYHMAFLGGWLINRYTSDENLRNKAYQAIRKIYFRHQNNIAGQSLFDLIFLHASGNGAYYRGVSLPATPETDAALGYALDSLRGFRAPPFFDQDWNNCEGDELPTGANGNDWRLCIGLDGQSYRVHLENGKVMADRPIPMAIRPANIYYWRSDPRLMNSEGTSGNGLYPASDFRLAYWMGRWIRRE